MLFRSGFIGEGPFEKLHAGTDATDSAKALMFGAFQAMRHEVLRDLLLATATKEELAAGKELPAERLAQLKLDAGRWLDIHGNKSVRGSSVWGAQWTQFKGWAIPPALTIAEDLGALYNRFGPGGSGEKMKPEQKADVARLAMTAAMAALVGTWATKEKENNTWVGRAIHYLRGEIWSIAGSPKVLAMMVGGGVLTAEAAKLTNHLIMLGTLEKFEKDTTTHDAGDLKAPGLLKKDITPALLKQAQSKEK